MAGGELTMGNSQKTRLTYVYNQPNRHGRDRYYFWRGNKGCRKFRVKDDVITGGAFHQAYGRFLDGHHPYPDQERAERTQASKKFAVPITGSYPRESWGWLVQEYLRSFAFKRLKNGR